MNKNEIKNQLVELCSQIFQNSGVDKDLIEYVDFTDDLGMDSITFVTLIVEIEAHFGITIPDDLLSMDNFKNIFEVSELIFNQLAHNASLEEQ